MKLLMYSLIWTACVFCPAVQAQTIEGAVERVIDGDTFAFSGVKIRICGIDAPELEQMGGQEARQTLKALIEGKRVRCTPVGGGTVCDGRSKTTNRGRIVAQCFVRDTDIAGVLVNGGSACDWLKFSGGAYPGGCSK